LGAEAGTGRLGPSSTSGGPAREGERKGPPPELKAQMEELDALSEGVPEFFDIKQPWLHSPQ
jgi:hypothetical protein